MACHKVFLDDGVQRLALAYSLSGIVEALVGQQVFAADGAAEGGPSGWIHAANGQPTVCRAIRPPLPREAGVAPAGRAGILADHGEVGHLP